MNQLLRCASRTLLVFSLLLFGVTALSSATVYAVAITACDVLNPGGCYPVQQDGNGKFSCGGSCASGLLTRCECQLLTAKKDNITQYYCECKLKVVPPPPPPNP